MLPGCYIRIPAPFQHPGTGCQQHTQQMRYRVEFRPKPSGKGALRLVFTLPGRDRETVGLGLSATSAEWDTAKAFVRPGTPSYARLAAIRAGLDRLITSAMGSRKAITSADVMGIMGMVENVRAEVGEVVKAKEGAEVWGWLFTYAAGKGTSTAATYRAALLSWQRLTNGAAPSPATLAEWNTALVRDGALEPGSAHTYLSAVQAMLRRARKAKVIDWVAEVDRPRLAAKRGKIALSDAQVAALEVMPLKGEQALVRDLFLLGLRTSLRRSDWDLRLEELGTTKVNTKGKGTSLIPKTAKLRALLGKYGGHLAFTMFRPDATENTRKGDFDAVLAEVMRLLSVKCPELSEVVTQWGKRVPKYRTIGSHSGRKSAINRWARTLPAAVIMKATGHKSLAQLQGYIQATVDDKETARLFS